MQILIGESKMSILSQQITESNVTAGNTDISLNCSTVNKNRGEINALMLQKCCLLPRVRENKILAVRQQLAEGTYNIDERFNSALDGLLEDLIG
jgi:anti-sigma28 factor (negative regulator of flagellin synthesis)